MAIVEVDKDRKSLGTYLRFGLMREMQQSKLLGDGGC